MRASWGTCALKACTLASRAATRAARGRIDACASGGVRSQSAGGQGACVSMRRSYAIDIPSGTYLLTR